MKYRLVEDNLELVRAICSRMGLDGHQVDHAELQARCRAVLRRNTGTAQPRTAFVRAFDKHEGLCFSKQKLVNRLFSYDDEVSENAVEVYIGRLRKHLEGSSVLIRALRDLGYRLDHDG